eukprot:TRINITY_DN3874_c0_g1_i3.p1 TRINITY_DN3874_c0_g1~~TRINITY_DN3874_c0_g1_i3.p1  ORF type:complete len:665 (+),score=220.17 TRINITY_DN3874_c0_g1_i3:68-2062(+)
MKMYRVARVAVGGSLRSQVRTSVERRGRPSEEDERMGRGLWGESTEVSSVPKSSHFGVFKVPEFNYIARRYEKTVSVGIDLGTTNSCVSYIDPETGVPLIVPIEGKKTTPTVIGLASDNQRYFGHEAFTMVKSTPGLSVCSGKRLLGKQIFDPTVPLEVYEDSLELFQSSHGIAVRLTKVRDTHTNSFKEFSVVHIMGMFLRYLKTSAENSLGMNVDSATISVPAHFSLAQRKATEDAAIIAGFDVKEIIDEPSAAALAYSTLVGKMKYEDRDHAKVAVFDLGGGTFDLAVLSIDNVNNGSEIIASGGDDRLGGDDFDTILLNYWKEELSQYSWNPELTVNLETTLKSKAPEAKIALDKAEEYTTTVPVYITQIKLQRIPMSITRFEYEELVRPLVQRLEACTLDILKRANIEPTTMDDILLVGEMTRTPIIVKLVEKIFGKKPTVSDVVTPGTVVSLGAALRGKQLDELSENPELARNFMYDKNSLQYEKNLSGVSLLMHKASKAWTEYKKYRKEKMFDRVERLRAEQGVPEEAIAKMTREVIEMELWMRKQKMAKTVAKEARDLINDINVWKEPRQGFIDTELDEYLEVLKFWLRVAEQTHHGEEQLAQALWELRFYFGELTGRHEKTAYEEIVADPEVQKFVNSGAAPSRSFTKNRSSDGA